MTEKDLNDPDIFSGLHEVGGEGMAEGVERNGFGDSRCGHGFLEGATHRSSGDWSLRFLAGKEVGSLWMNVFPVLMQEVEKTTTERNVSVFGPFSVAYVDQHACAVDVSGTAEPTNLRDSHSSGVSRRDNRSVLDGLYGPKQSKNLILAEQVRQGFRRFRIRYSLDFLRPIEGDSIQELHRSDIHLLD